MQKTYPAGSIRKRTRSFKKGDRIEPLDLIEWSEEQGYEPEAQVTQKGELALRGGIVDLFPLTSPWPVRLEFFGDELDSLRYFDPHTQISREEITSINIPPAGELGILKRLLNPDPENGNVYGTPKGGNTNKAAQLGTLIDYLPHHAIFVLCDPEQLETSADDYARQVANADPFYVGWEDFQEEATHKGATLINLAESRPHTAGEEESGEVSDLGG